MTFPPGIMPLPAITDDTRPFWDGGRQRTLLIQQCSACDAFRHPPTPVCWRCRSFAHRWTPVSGRGTVFSHATVHRAFLPGLEPVLPYVVVVVALDGAPGVRLVSNLIDGGVEAARIGLPVEVVFEDVSADVTVPRFRARVP